MCKFLFCSAGSLARFLDIREQDAPTTNFILAKLGCSLADIYANAKLYLNKLQYKILPMNTGSLKQLNRAKRQTSCSMGGDVETSPHNVVGWGS